VAVPALHALCDPLRILRHLVRLVTEALRIGKACVRPVPGDVLGCRSPALCEVLPERACELRQVLLNMVKTSLHLAEPHLQRPLGGGRRLAGALGGDPYGLGCQPELLAALPDFFTRMALLFGRVTALLRVLTLPLRLLPLLFGLHKIVLLQTLYHIAPAAIAQDAQQHDGRTLRISPPRQA